MFGSKTHQKYADGEYCQFLTVKKEDSEHLKIKWTDSRKEDRIIIKNVLLNYSKKRVSVPTQQYFNGAYMEETVHDLATKIRQRKYQRHVPIKKMLRAP